MNQHHTLINATLAELFSGCCQEQAKGVKDKSSGYSFELFRRALEQHDNDAWFGIQQQFRPLFARWVLEAAHFELDHFRVEDLLQTALARFWYALSDSDQPLAERFPCAGALLKYMKCCVQTACLEWQRGELRQQRLERRLALATIIDMPQRPLEADWLQKAHISRCEDVRHWLEECCQDEAEKLVYRLTYEENLKPRQIAAQHPGQFPAVQDVYRIKLRLYRRIQRALG